MEHEEESEAGSDISELPLTGRVQSLIKQIETASLSSKPPGYTSADPVINGKSETPSIDEPVTEVGDENEEKLDAARRKKKLSKSSSLNGESSSVFKSFGWKSFRQGGKSRETRASQFFVSPSSISLASESSCDTSSERPGLLPSPRDNDGDSVRIYGGSMEFAPLDSDGDSVQNVEAPASLTDSASLKSFLVAKELVTSEQVYIQTLQLLNVHFRNYVEYHNHQSKTKLIPDADLKKILNQLPELQSLNQDLLLDLEDRLANWEANPKIADVIVKKGAFLKMYSTYIQNFESQTQFLDECYAKHVKFAQLAKEFEAQERCKNLTLKHYMLKPVQRVPQYRLLLDDYLKHLCVTGPDYEDTLTALRIVTNVAEHVNNSLKHGDNVGRMVQLQSMLSDFQLIEPGRELIKDGPLQKVCRKSAKDRYFILLNDCLVYSTSLHQAYLKYNHSLSLGGMKVTYSEDDTNLFTFAVYSTTKSFILCAKSEKERKEWVEALRKAIDDYVLRRKSFMIHAAPASNETFKLGKEAPVWVPDGKVTMCQICTADFTHLFRRHHCRACGKVICWKCSRDQAPLLYMAYKAQRVCEPCFDQLLHDFEESEELIKKSLPGDNEEAIQNAYLNLKAKFQRPNYIEERKQKKIIPSRLKEVSAKDAEADMSGWLRVWKSNKWKVDKNWYVLKDRVLYVYGASEDVAASESISILGYQIEHQCEDLDNVSGDLIIKLTHRCQKPMIFAADTSESADRWFQVLTAAASFQDLA